MEEVIEVSAPADSMQLSCKPHRATYSLEDDKLRLYPAFRLDPEDWAKFKSLGFMYAPKQGFIGQVWSPGREDLVLQFSEDIEDEDMTIEERAAMKAERLAGYAEHASQRAENARDRVEQLTDGIPLGQPILVGHHSEKRACKDAERIESSMSKVVEEMKRADYWQYRAQGVLRHALRRERPDVIYRRIDKLEAELRKHEKAIKWSAYDVEYAVSRIMQDELKKHWSVEYNDISEEEKQFVQRRVAEKKEAHKRHEERWIEHLKNRIAYERMIYEGSGGIAAEKSTVEIGGAVLVFGKWREIVKVNKKTVSVPSGYSWLDKVELSKVKHFMSKAEYEAYTRGEFIPDWERKRLAVEVEKANEYRKPKPWEALEKVEVTVIGGVDDLFPTPDAVIDRMFEALPPSQAGWTLEPSAGTGAIAKRLLKAGVSLDNIHLIEKNGQLANGLSNAGFFVLAHGDFLEYAELCKASSFRYGRIYMNPPFSNGQDVEHVMAAYELLVDGGGLVAIMSEHPFFASDLKSDRWRSWFTTVDAVSTKLPPDAFQASGTGVQTRMVVIHKP